MPEVATPPINEKAFLLAMQDQFDTLSRQLKLIARYVEAKRSQIGIQSIQEVADACAVQPSAVVRFAKHFGFDGFTAMQRVFRDGLAQKIAPTRSYQSRIRQAIESGARDLRNVDIAHTLIEGSLAGLQELQAGLDAKAFDGAVKALVKADSIWLAGARRSFPVATYLAYAMQHTDKRVHTISSLGAMHEGQLRGLRAQDVLVAVSFAPYAEETLHIARLAHAKGAKIIAITDSALSPLLPLAKHTLIVQETSVFGFRALTNSMALAQSLFLALAYRLELDYQPPASRAGFLT